MFQLKTERRKGGETSVEDEGKAESKEKEKNAGE